MSGVSGITSQLNNTNACNNCNDDGLKSRLQKVEADNAQQEAHLTLLDSKIKPDGAPVFGTLEQQLKALQGELSAVKNFADFLSNGLQTKEDKGGLASTEQIAKQALQVANAAYDAVFALDESISVIQSILPIISGKADAGYALAQKAYNLADATSTVTQIHTKEIDNLQIRVQSLEDRVSKLEQNQGDLNNLKDRVGSLENWRTGTVATLILLALQISKLKNRLDNLPPATKGEKGDKGLPGVKGDRGLKGERGLPGVKGDKGLPGTKGDPGLQGERGLPGTNGNPGLPGNPGFSGSNGQPGVKGTNGAPGANGTPGTKGINGAPGINGQPGTTGQPGINGQPGTNGQPGAKGKDAQVEFITINAKKFDKCEDNLPQFTTMEVAVIKGTQLSESLKFERLANVEGQQCTECSENVHGSPEWWEVRPGSDRPQLLLLFSPKGSNRANYQITIPHWTGEKPSPKNPPISDYKKGSLMAVMHLADTSKLIVNAEDRNEAQRVLNKVASGISYVRRIGSRVNYTELDGSGIKEQTMICRYAVYYPKGQKSKTPEWTVKFEIKQALLN